MSAHKRKNTVDIQPIFSKIKDVVARIKLRLSDLTQDADHTQIIDELSRAAALAESFSDQRPQAVDDCQEMVDYLDAEGTSLWNTSSTIRQVSNDAELFVMARLAAFRLIQAGIEPDPSTDTLIHMLQLASKTGTGLSSIDKHDAAARVLTSAAIHEEALRSTFTPSVNPFTTGGSSPTLGSVRGDDKKQTAQVRRQANQATVSYFSARMEAAWAEGNEGVAAYMLHRITETESRLLDSLTSHDIKILANKFLMIGKSLLRLSYPSSTLFASQAREDENATRAETGQVRKEKVKEQGKRREEERKAEARRAGEAVKYLQRAYALVERLGEGKKDIDEVETGGLELRKAILRALSRAYYLSHSLDQENYARAEATVDELIAIIEAEPISAQSDSEYQHSRWMRLQLLKRRKADDKLVTEALSSIIDHMLPEEEDVKEVLQELRTLTPKHALVTQCLQYLLDRVLSIKNLEEKRTTLVAQVVLSIIFHCSKDEEPERGIGQLTKAFDMVHNAECTLEKTPCASCVTLLWQAASRHYTAKRFSSAAALFTLGSHKAFESLGTSALAKCTRKAAICHLEAREFARAIQAVRRGDEKSKIAATGFVLFLVACEQGLEDEASKAVDVMVRGVDFEPRMLRLATQRARERGLRAALLSVLEATLHVLRGGPRTPPRTDIGVEPLTLVRSLIRLAKELLAKDGSNQQTLIEMLIKYFTVACELVEAAFEEKKELMLSKDIDWLWRAAYNLAIQGCSEWGDMAERASDLFDLSKQLMELRVKASVTNIEEELRVHIMYAGFAALTGRVFAVQDRAQDSGIDEVAYRALLSEFETFKETLRGVLANGDITNPDFGERARRFLHALRLWKTQFCIALGEWTRIPDVIQELTQPPEKILPSLTLQTCEAVTDMLWAREDCPFNVLYIALENMLHASLEADDMDVEKFSRWLRAVCMLLLTRDDPADRARAAGYVEQAAAVMEQRVKDGNDDYPVDERQWLLATAFNTGVECYRASYIDEAKRWLECATQICRFVPYAEARAEKVRLQLIVALTPF